MRSLLNALSSSLLALFLSHSKRKIRSYDSPVLRPRTLVLKETEENLTIVGDLHGQLEDLILILDSNGLPTKTQKYIFNGDFVDRGPNGVEVVTLLLIMQSVYPESVFLNR